MHWIGLDATRPTAVAKEAVAAWREQHGDAAARWRTIPGPLRAAFGSEPHLVQHHTDAQRSDRESIKRYQRKMRVVQPRDGTERVLDVVVPLILCLVGLALVAVLGTGLWKMLVWFTT